MVSGWHGCYPHDASLPGHHLGPYTHTPLAFPLPSCDAMFPLPCNTSAHLLGHVSLWRQGLFSPA